MTTLGDIINTTVHRDGLEEAIRYADSEQSEYETKIEELESEIERLQSLI